MERTILSINEIFKQFTICEVLKFSLFSVCEGLHGGHNFSPAGWGFFLAGQGIKRLQESSPLPCVHVSEEPGRGATLLEV